MNHWYQIRRLRAAVMIILVGVLALLNQWNILRWNVSWPLFLIVLGLLILAERAAWCVDARDQQTAQGFASGLQDSVPGQPVPPGVSGPTWTSSSPTGDRGTGSFVQPHSPAPEDSGREDR